jgi:hypothetical protein
MFTLKGKKIWDSALRDLKPKVKFRFIGSATLVIGYAAWFTKNPVDLKTALCL